MNRTLVLTAVAFSFSLPALADSVTVATSEPHPHARYNYYVIGGSPELFHGSFSGGAGSTNGDRVQTPMLDMFVENIVPHKMGPHNRGGGPSGRGSSNGGRL